jgi:hypothetical protein
MVSDRERPVVSHIHLPISLTVTFFLNKLSIKAKSKKIRLIVVRDQKLCILELFSFFREL